MAAAKEVTLDVRQMPPWERHPKIFEIIDNLAVGDALRLVNDHDPRPLHYQILAERPGQFEYNSREEGAHEWVARITRVAAAAS